MSSLMELESSMSSSSSPLSTTRTRPLLSLETKTLYKSQTPNERKTHPQLFLSLRQHYSQSMRRQRQDTRRRASRIPQRLSLLLYLHLCHLLLLFINTIPCITAWSTRRRPSFRPTRRGGSVSFSSTSTSAAALPILRHQSTALQSSNHHNNDSYDNDDSDKLDLNLLVLDHYDSFTYNLVDLLGQVCRRPPLVWAADSVDSWDDLQTQLPWSNLDGLILSPGPGSPEQCRLALQVVANYPQLPILGVCLGHQVLGVAYGANCSLAPTPVHGQVQAVDLVDDSKTTIKTRYPSLFATHDTAMTTTTPPLLQSSLNVTRYHSLHVTWDTETTTIPLRPTAWSRDDVPLVMALQHVTNPHYGVQFHPESVGSLPHGLDLLQRFCRICHDIKREREKEEQPVLVPRPLPTTAAVNGQTTNNEKSLHNTATPTTTPHKAHQQRYQVWIHKVGATHMRPEHVMQVFFGDKNSDKNSRYRFWLDEASCLDGETAATSLLGCLQTSRRVEYWGPEKAPQQQGLHIWNNDTDIDKDYSHDPQQDILTYLQTQHAETTTTRHVHLVSWTNSDEGNDQELQVTSRVSEQEANLPFAFRGGHVGYLGYEVRHVTEPRLAQQEHGSHEAHAHDLRLSAASKSSDAQVPTAAFGFSDQTMVYDHASREWYLVGVVDAELEQSVETQQDQKLEWMRTTATEMLQWRPVNGVNGHHVNSNDNHVQNKQEQEQQNEHPVVFTPNRSRETYNRNFASCLQHIRNGDSYELCLTNQLEAKVESAAEPLDLYFTLRKKNPAPFSAFMDWNPLAHFSESGSALSICCSSPERFVSVMPMNENLFQVEAKPIKGTIARVLPNQDHHSQPAEDIQQLQQLDRERAESLRLSVKDRAENLMIVDLLRNDLSRVCQVGSVHVPKLMAIETYATVHQMVSTIRGTLNVNTKNDQSAQSAVDVLTACFPGGSMTGAPKVRTMELLDQLEEGHSRGVYSGSIGYISLNGAIDMNKVIRTAVLTPQSPFQAKLKNDNDNDKRMLWNVSIGAGGAITALSDNDDEYNEMILKASAVTEAVKMWGRGPSSTARSGPEPQNEENALGMAHEKV